MQTTENSTANLGGEAAGGHMAVDAAQRTWSPLNSACMSYSLAAPLQQAPLTPSAAEGSLLPATCELWMK